MNYSKSLTVVGVAAVAGMLVATSLVETTSWIKRWLRSTLMYQQ
jgi:hypothetical protein